MRLKPDLIELNEAADGFFKIAEDPRITRVGPLPAADAAWTSCRSSSTCCAAR